LTENRGTDDCASWSSDSSSVVFVSDRDGSMDVWTILAEGGEPTRITTSSSREGWPSWSPDGAKIAFNSDRSGNLDIWVVDIGKARTQTGTAWIQWGGPSRNFMVETTGLADTWPPEGPKRLWHRRLGDGYSSIVYDDGVLYTVYRKRNTDPNEYVIALDATTGRDIWQHRIRSPVHGNVGEWTFGPNATPLVVGEHVYATGVHAELHCLNKKTGARVWDRDLGGTAQAPIPDNYGFSCSPLAYKHTIIIPADRSAVVASTGTSRGGAAGGGRESEETGTRQVLAALDPLTGDTVWTGGDFTVGHSSPVLIEFAGDRYVVMFVMDGIFGFDPDSGEVRWHHPLAQEMGSDAISTPVWDGENLLYCASQNRNAGGRVVKLTKKDNRVTTEELWFSSKKHFGNVAPIRIGEYLFGAAGQALLGVHMESGRRVWAKRGFQGGTVVHADGKLVVLDLNGKLGLLTVTPEGATVHSTCQVAERVSLTPPTLVGTTLYVRDRKHIMAFDLGA
jgi:outer membrane protein assembly factor BamB